MSKTPGKKPKDEWQDQLKEVFSKEKMDKLLESNQIIEEDKKPINIGFIEGKLVTKKRGVGTLSEGVVYFIIPDDKYKDRWNEVLVRKKTLLWQNDSQLHPFVQKLVRIKGDIIETRTSITVDCIEIWEK